MEYDSILSEPLYKEVEFYAWEKRLFQTSFVKRLKYLAHFGGGAFVSPVVHSRYEHTVGVWKLAALYFPNHDVLRAAAILHDIGHLPFSHAVEKPLDYNHHALTEAYIQDGEIASILHTADLQSGDVVQYLRQPSPLTGTREVLGLDHLDSFLRDTYMSGRMEELPSEVLKRIHCSDRGVETDKQTGLQLLRLIIRDHELFLSPLLLAVDRLLAEAISILWNNGGGSKEAFAKQTDADVIAILKSSQNSKVRAIIHTILYHPEQIHVHQATSEQGIRCGVRKVYQKSPIANGRTLAETVEGKAILNRLEQLKKEYEVSIPLLV